MATPSEPYQRIDPSYRYFYDSLTHLTSGFFTRASTSCVGFPDAPFARQICRLLDAPTGARWG